MFSVQISLHFILYDDFCLVIGPFPLFCSNVCCVKSSFLAVTSYFTMDPWGDGHCWVHLNVSSYIQGSTEKFLSQNWLKHCDPFISLAGDLTGLISKYHSTQSLVWGHLNCVVLNMLGNQSTWGENYWPPPYFYLKECLKLQKTSRDVFARIF